MRDHITSARPLLTHCRSPCLPSTRQPSSAVPLALRHSTEGAEWRVSTLCWWGRGRQRSSAWRRPGRSRARPAGPAAASRPRRAVVTSHRILPQDNTTPPAVPQLCVKCIAVLGRAATRYLAATPSSAQIATPTQHCNVHRFSHRNLQH